jgi:geranylgeranyl diphosphate synthase type II
LEANTTRRDQHLAAAFLSSLDRRRERIEQSLRTALDRVVRDAPSSLAEAMAYSLLAPGKRLRPLLVLLSAEAAGGSEESALPGACAVEMVHAYSLVHDDLPAMDDDDLRRGLPTCHKKFGEALAILAGDALSTGAFQVLAEGCLPAIAAVSIAELSRGAGAAGMVGGQVLDLGAEGKVPMVQPPNTAADLESIHRRKTGALFLTALRLGAFAAQADTPVREALDRFGRAFGLAFQIADDLLDVQGSVGQTGKRVGKDAGRGKLTFPGLLGVDESRRRARVLYEEAAAALDGLGPPAKPLAELAKYVMERDR